MSDEIKIKGRIEVDAASSATTVSNLQAEIKKLESALKNVDVSSKEYKKGQQQLIQKQNELKNVTSGTTGQFGKLKQGLGEVGGAAGGASGGIGILNQAFNMLRANPIILVITVLVMLIVQLWQKFSAMEKVSDTLTKAFGQLSGLLNTFVNAILTPLIDGFVMLVDYAMKAANVIVSFFSPAMGEAMNRTGELVEQLDDLEDAERDSAIARAESNRALQQAKEAAEDANLPISERIKKLKEASAIEQAETQKSIEIAQTRARIMLEQLAQENGARQEVIDKIRQGTVESMKAARADLLAMDNIDKNKFKDIDKNIIDAEDNAASLAKINKKTNATIESLQKEHNSNLESQRKEAASKAKAAADKAAADRRNAAEQAYQHESTLLKMRNDAALQIMKDGKEKEFAALDQKYKDEQRAIEKSVADKKISQKQAAQILDYSETIYNNNRALITDKFNKAEIEKQKAFANELSKIKNDTLLAGITDARQKETIILEQGYKEQLATAIEKYKENETQLNAVKEALRIQKEQADKQLAAKYESEDLKAMQDLSLKKIGWQLTQDNTEINQKRALLDQKQKLIDAQFNAEIQAAGNNAIKKQQIEQQHLEVTSEIAAARVAITNAERDAKIQAAESTANTLTNLADVFGKQTALGKTMAIASTVISTIASAQKAYQATVGIPFVGPALAPINAGLALAAGYKNVKAITAVNIPGQGGTSAPTPNISTPSSPVSPQATSTRLDANSINQVGNAAQGGVSRAFVLDSDINNAAMRNERINRAARLG